MRPHFVSNDCTKNNCEGWKRLRGPKGYCTSEWQARGTWRMERDSEFRITEPTRVSQSVEQSWLHSLLATVARTGPLARFSTSPSSRLRGRHRHASTRNRYPGDRAVAILDFSFLCGIEEHFAHKGCRAEIRNGRSVCLWRRLLVIRRLRQCKRNDDLYLYSVIGLQTAFSAQI